MSFQTNYIHLADEILSGKTSISYEQALEILNSDENCGKSTLLPYTLKIKLAEIIFALTFY